MDLAVRLRDEARAADERRVLVLAGAPDRTRARAGAALEAAGVAPADARLVGAVDCLDCERVPPARASSLLGSTHSAVVVDCHESCPPNVLGQTVGAVDGGGLLLLLTPPLPEWPDRRDGFDDSLAVPPFDIGDVTGHFRRRLVETLEAHRGVAIVDVDAGETRDEGLTHPDPAPPRTQPTAPADTAFPTAAYDACRTRDQAAAVETLERLREPGTAVVLEADRGRGKSSAAGLAAGALALDGRDVLVTAREYAGCRPVFARARELLTDLGELAGTDRMDNPHRLATETGRVRYAAPADAAALPDDPDVVLVDEAAGLPVRRLSAFLATDAVAFVTTVHGYEGAGRGFSVRFRDRLADSDFAVAECQLTEPIRYAPGDPVEVWSFRALCLDASPAVEPVVADATPATVDYRAFEPEELLADDQLLREVFGLLVLAHYRTEPNDLARLLDAPNVAVRGLVHDGHVAAVALLAREGGLAADRRARMYEGERVRGNMLPDVLTSQLRDEAAGELVGQRVLRIATHPARRSRGLGSQLVEGVRREFADSVDWLGVGYGATPELVDFWGDNGFATVHCSTTRNDASGEYSAIMLEPCSPAGADLCERHTEWFQRRLPAMLADPLADLDPDVVRAVLRTVDGTPALDLSPWEWRHLAGLPAGTAIFDTAPRGLRRLALRHLVAPEDPALLEARAERLLVRKALQGRPWGATARALDYPSHAECMRALGRATATLLDCYGGETAAAERRRFQ